jgi:hypothetical protein
MVAITRSFRFFWMGLVVLSLISLGGCRVERDHDHHDHDFHDHHEWHDDHHDHH